MGPGWGWVRRKDGTDPYWHAVEAVSSAHAPLVHYITLCAPFDATRVETAGSRFRPPRHEPVCGICRSVTER